MSPSAIMIILLSAGFLLIKGVPFAFNESALSFETLPSYNDLNFPSKSIPAGIPLDLNCASSGVFLFSSRLTIAGVPIDLELADDCSKNVLCMPSAFTVSIEFANREATRRRFLLIG